MINISPGGISRRWEDGSVRSMCEHSEALDVSIVSASGYNSIHRRWDEATADPSANE